MPPTTCAHILHVTGAVFHSISYDSAIATPHTFEELVGEQVKGGLNEQVAPRVAPWKHAHGTCTHARWGRTHMHAPGPCPCTHVNAHAHAHAPWQVIRELTEAGAFSALSDSLDGCLAVSYAPAPARPCRRPCTLVRTARPFADAACLLRTPPAICGHHLPFADTTCHLRTPPAFCGRRLPFVDLPLDSALRGASTAQPPQAAM